MGEKGQELVCFISILKRHMPEFEEEYKVRSLGIFGSYVCGEQKEGSDLEVLVEFYEALSLLGLVGLEHHLSDLLGVKVDLVLKSGLKPLIGKRILEEVLAV